MCKMKKHYWSQKREEHLTYIKKYRLNELIDIFVNCNWVDTRWQ